MTFDKVLLSNLAACNLLLPLLIHKQPLGHPCSGVRYLGATHSLITNHLVDRSQVLRELYVIFWDTRVIQINLKIWSALVWCRTIKNVYWGYLCWAATEAVWERLNRGDMKALLRLIFKSCFFLWQNIKRRNATCKMPLFGFSGLVNTEWDSDTLGFNF